MSRANLTPDQQAIHDATEPPRCPPPDETAQADFDAALTRGDRRAACAALCRLSGAAQRAGIRRLGME